MENNQSQVEKMSSTDARVRYFLFIIYATFP